ncbi:MAG: hypothetical protein PHR28_09920 [candidate division Zixibacteria bacterium]|nr:hypothetical protein [candidate division Zixibacteria bacterium]
MDDKNANETRIEQEIAKTMSRLDDLPILTAAPDFYDRLEQRLARLESAEHRLTARLFGNFRLGYALLLIMVLANLATAYFAGHPSNATDNRDQNLESLAAEYMPNMPSSLISGQ